MGCGYNNEPITGWYEIQRAVPTNPLDLIAYADLGGIVGAFSNSTNYGVVAGTWVASPWTFGLEPSASSLATDQLATVAEATQWNMKTTAYNTLATLPIPLRKIIFLKAGTTWQTAISIQFGVNSYDDMQLSFRDNAGTRGDMSGTTPVIGFAGAFTGLLPLLITAKYPTKAIMGLRARHVATGDYSMFEMEWNIVP